jgi:toxin ParE1/3/4
MKTQILTTPQAKEDLRQIALYLGEHAGLPIAERFLIKVQGALNQLAAMPLMGTPWQSNHPRLKDVRTWIVPSFRKHLIFYRPVEEGIELLHVYHSARDVRELLEDEAGAG